MYFSTTDRCSETVHIQPQSCDHTSNRHIFFSRIGISSSAAANGQPLPYLVAYLNFSTCFMKNVILEKKIKKQ